MKQVTLITDGACLGNPGPGGWAAILKFGGVEKRFVGSSPDTTNNRMELSAVIEGLKRLKEPCEVDLYSDSKYVVDAVNEGWLKNWRLNDWKDSRNKPVKNLDLWLEFCEQIEIHKLNLNWVKGHSGDPDNEAADRLAQKAALQQLSGEVD